MEAVEEGNGIWVVSVRFGSPFKHALPRAGRLFGIWLLAAFETEFCSKVMAAFISPYMLQNSAMFAGLMPTLFPK